MPCTYLALLKWETPEPRNEFLTFAMLPFVIELLPYFDSIDCPILFPLFSSKTFLLKLFFFTKLIVAPCNIIDSSVNCCQQFILLSIIRLFAIFCWTKLTSWTLDHFQLSCDGAVGPQLFFGDPKLSNVFLLNMVSRSLSPACRFGELQLSCWTSLLLNVSVSIFVDQAFIPRESQKIFAQSISLLYTCMGHYFVETYSPEMNGCFSLS